MTAFPVQNCKRSQHFIKRRRVSGQADEAACTLRSVYTGKLGHSSALVALWATPKGG